MNQISQTIASDKSFDTYVRFLAIKRHFTTDSYDYFKYNGKVRANNKTFMARNDAYSFAKLGKREDNQGLILANVLVKPDIWVRDLLDEEAEERYILWKKKIEALGYNFKSDLGKLYENYQENFISYDGQHPYIMTKYLQKQISLETLTILAHSANIFSYWDKKVVDKIVAYDIIRLVRKYKPFLTYDEKRFKDIVREFFF
jgi:hypothetical protein|tara:strand:- start:1288 stop:1890 length:603 start_codon:yes stop_codon:yes gene_type:complete